MKTNQKIYLSVYAALVLILNSCGFGESEYYTYTTNDGYNEIYFLWADSSKCGVTICDTTIKFDGLKLFFTFDNSTVNADCEKYFSHIKNDKREIVDSVENCAWYFNIPENDSRIKENSFATLYLLNGKAIVLVDTLYRKKEKITIIDQLPLPKLH